MSDSIDNSPATKQSHKVVEVNGFFNSGEAEEAFLYDPELVQDLHFAESNVKFDPKISASAPGPGLLVRPLSSGDFDRGAFNNCSRTRKFCPIKIKLPTSCTAAREGRR